VIEQLKERVNGIINSVASEVAILEKSTIDLEEKVSELELKRYYLEGIEDCLSKTDGLDTEVGKVKKLMSQIAQKQEQLEQQGKAEIRIHLSDGEIESYWISQAEAERFVEEVYSPARPFAKLIRRDGRIYLFRIAEILSVKLL
jgi:archaellum component FlaC